MFGVEFLMRRNIWVPPKHTYKKTDDDCDVFVKIISGDQIHLRLFSPDSTVDFKNYDNSKRLVLYFHGNAEDLSSCDAYLCWLALNTDQNVIGVDYVGYGKSSCEHETTEQNMCDAADASLDFAIHTLKQTKNTTMIIGRSLGSIPAVYLASQQMNAGLGGLILISALASGARCVLPSAYTPESILSSMDSLFGANILRISEVQCMILFIHGDNDKQVPIANARALFSRCNRWCLPEIFVVKGGGHNDLLDLYGKQILRQINEFKDTSAVTARLRTGDEAAHTPYEDLVEF
jgi:abhydrolase domain-containing protein 17